VGSHYWICKYMYMYIYKYEYVCIYVYTYMYVYISICVYMYVYIYIIYIYIHIYIFTYVYIYILHLCICIYVFIYMYIYVCMYTYIPAAGFDRRVIAVSNFNTPYMSQSPLVIVKTPLHSSTLLLIFLFLYQQKFYREFRATLTLPLIES
jgi:hypothetical protein